MTSRELSYRAVHFEPAAVRDCRQISTRSRLAWLWMCCSVGSKLRHATADNLKRVDVDVVAVEADDWVLHSQTEISAGYSNRICTWWQACFFFFLYLYKTVKCVCALLAIAHSPLLNTTFFFQDFEVKMARGVSELCCCVAATTFCKNTHNNALHKTDSPTHPLIFCLFVNLLFEITQKSQSHTWIKLLFFVQLNCFTLKE